MKDVISYAYVIMPRYTIEAELLIAEPHLHRKCMRCHVLMHSWVFCALALYTVDAAHSLQQAAIHMDELMVLVDAQ